LKLRAKARVWTNFFNQLRHLRKLEAGYIAVESRPITAT
jgi:hypothetical protein